jgi:hypothetical protein
MTDRISGYVITLTDYIVEPGDRARVLSAIRMIKGVRDLKPVTAEMNAEWAEGVVRDHRDTQWRDALYRLCDRGPDAILAATEVGGRPSG